MPGSFLPTCNEPPVFHRPSARSAFFIPPSSSPARNRSTSSHSSTRPSATSTTALSLRKRARLDTSCQITRISSGPRPVGDRDDDNEPPSPVPLVNTDYRIAGGLDTPRAERADRDEGVDWELEKDLRVNRFTHPRPAPSDACFPRTPQHAGDMADGTSQGPPQPCTTGWGRTLWSLTGGVAGKLINLCWTTAFSGFHAGGGRGYHMQLDTPTVTAAEPRWPDQADDVFDSHFRRRGRSGTPIPGEFPEDDSVQDECLRLRQRQDAETPLQMASNDAGASSLRRNWVMIASPSGRRSESASPVRKKHRASTSISQPARAIARPSYGSRPQRKPTGGGASYASPRSSLRSGSSSLLSPPPSSHRPVSLDHGRPYSPPRQNQNNNAHPASRQPSPKSPDVLRFERKLRHDNLRQSDSIKRMNERMKQLLQEGQQALASKVEVSDPIDDDHDGHDDTGGLGADEFDLDPTTTHYSHAQTRNPTRHAW
ncbi:hypothetical protein DV735_g5750, partial [Chaetothyriales sp. CBS 134920]